MCCLCRSPPRGRWFSGRVPRPSPTGVGSYKSRRPHSQIRLGCDPNFPGESRPLSSPFACTPSAKTPGLETSFERTQQSTSCSGAANQSRLASTDLKPARYRAWRVARASDLNPKTSVNSSSKYSSNFWTHANLSRVHGHGTKQSGSDPN